MSGLGTGEERARSVETTHRNLTDDELRTLYAAPRTPWLRVNFVSTVDGAATGGDGLSGSINNEADGRIFHLLRDLCDVVIVGAGTARAEGYRPADKPIVLVSRSGEVPERLQAAASGSVLLGTTAQSPGLDRARELLGTDNVIVTGEGEVDLSALKTELAERGFADMLCEGGPHLFDAMVQAGVVDELCLTQVPRLVGGRRTRITAGVPAEQGLHLGLLLEEKGTLITRWLMLDDASPASIIR